MEEVLKYLKEQREKFIGYEDQFADEVIAIDKVIIKLEEAMKPKMCEQCDNNHKDRTIFYDGKKILMCTLCKHNAVSYFKPKDDE